MWIEAQIFNVRTIDDPMTLSEAFVLEAKPTKKGLRNLIEIRYRHYPTLPRPNKGDLVKVSASTYNFHLKVGKKSHVAEAYYIDFEYDLTFWGWIKHTFSKLWQK